MQLCRVILQSYPKHRASESALSMLEKYDREFRLKTIYAEVARLSALGSEKRQDAMLQLQESFAVGYGPEGLQLMKRLFEAEHAKDRMLETSHTLLWIMLGLISAPELKSIKAWHSRQLNFEVKFFTLRSCRFVV